MYFSVDLGDYLRLPFHTEWRLTLFRYISNSSAIQTTKWFRRWSLPSFIGKSNIAYCHVTIRANQKREIPTGGGWPEAPRNNRRFQFFYQPEKRLRCFLGGHVSLRRWDDLSTASRSAFSSSISNRVYLAISVVYFHSN